MKNFVSILALVFGVSLFLNSCNEDEPSVTYWYTYGTFIETDSIPSGYFIYLDNGQNLIPNEAGIVESDVEDSSRVVVVYSIVSETESAVTADVTEVKSILTKDVLQLTEENQDSIGSDGVLVSADNIWFSENHLNVGFTYYFYNKIHYINLVKPIGEQFDEKGNQILEFRHNANDDYLNAVYSGVVSFNMWSLHQEGMDSINILFKSVEYDSTVFTWEGTYHFNEQPIGITPYKGVPDFSEKVY